jgi:hypothetical protein
MKSRCYWSVGVCLLATIASACSGNSLTAPAAASPATTTRVDLLNFVVGDSSLWPRQGLQFQHQIVDLNRREVCWVKYADASMFECWRWDDQWIYHEVDHALDGQRAGESYAFTDARWLPRYLEPGQIWTLDVSDNRVRWFLRDCAETAPGSREGMPGTGEFPYQLRAALQPQRELGGDLGSRDVLVLDYGPHAPGQEPLTSERFLFARDAGWYRWESDRGTATFDQRGGPVVTRTAACGE